MSSTECGVQVASLARRKIHHKSSKPYLVRREADCKDQMCSMGTDSAAASSLLIGCRSMKRDMIGRREEKLRAIQSKLYNCKCRATIMLMFLSHIVDGKYYCSSRNWSCRREWLFSALLVGTIDSTARAVTS